MFGSKTETAVSAVAGAMLGAVLWLFGGWTEAMWVLLALMGLDVLSGLVRAVDQKDLSSDVMLHGGAKKVMVWVLVGLAASVDRLALDLDCILRNVVVLFYCGAEGLSILENAAAVGLGIPDPLRSVLRQLNPDKAG